MRLDHGLGVTLALVLGSLVAGFGFSAFRADRPAGQDGWLTGDTHQKFDTVAKHLRGFDLAMVEVGYRYNELYWAGQDENWGYAAYHAEKIRTATENGLERRPKRAESAQEFLNEALPAVEEAIRKQDHALFESRFKQMRQSCRECHVKEDVPFIQMETPRQRIMPFTFSDESM